MTEPFLPIELIPADWVITTPEAISLAQGIASDLRVRNTFSSFLKKMTVKAVYNMVSLQLIAEVLDRDDGTPTTLYFTRNLDVMLGISNPNFIVHQIVDFLRWTVQHEIDECVTIKNVRVRDPHRNEPTVDFIHWTMQHETKHQ